MSPEEEDAVREVLAALGDQDQVTLRQLLHPYLHWTQNGLTTRGRTNVLALLERPGNPTPCRPSAVELRDGQVYRWTVGHGAGG